MGGKIIVVNIHWPHSIKAHKIYTSFLQKEVKEKLWFLTSMSLWDNTAFQYFVIPFLSFWDCHVKVFSISFFLRSLKFLMQQSELMSCSLHTQVY
jgi:hypothetical protein